MRGESRGERVRILRRATRNGTVQVVPIVVVVVPVRGAVVHAIVPVRAQTRRLVLHGFAKRALDGGRSRRLDRRRRRERRGDAHGRRRRVSVVASRLLRARTRDGFVRRFRLVARVVEPPRTSASRRRVSKRRLLRRRVLHHDVTARDAHLAVRRHERRGVVVVFEAGADAPSNALAETNSGAFPAAYNSARRSRSRRASAIMSASAASAASAAFAAAIAATVASRRAASAAAMAGAAARDASTTIFERRVAAADARRESRTSRSASRRASASANVSLRGRLFFLSGEGSHTSGSRRAFSRSSRSGRFAFPTERLNGFTTVFRGRSDLAFDLDVFADAGDSEGAPSSSASLSASTLRPNATFVCRSRRRLAASRFASAAFSTRSASAARSFSAAARAAARAERSIRRSMSVGARSAPPSAAGASDERASSGSAAGGRSRAGADFDRGEDSSAFSSLRRLPADDDEGVSPSAGGGCHAPRGAGFVRYAARCSPRAAFCFASAATKRSAATRGLADGFSAAAAGEYFRASAIFAASA